MYAIQMRANIHNYRNEVHILRCSEKYFEGQRETFLNINRVPIILLLLFEVLHMSGAHKRNSQCTMFAMPYAQRKSNNITKLLYLNDGTVKHTTIRPHRTNKSCVQTFSEQRCILGI